MDDWKVWADRIERRLVRLEKRTDLKDGLIIRHMVEAVAAALGQTRRAIMDDLETRRTMSYAGTYDTERSYAPGSCVTSAGAVWVAVGSVQPGERPGAKGSPAWRLAAKSDSR